MRTHLPLIDAGLSEGEAEIYFALLKQGESLVSTLARVTGAHRTHIYDTLEKLMLKGLVNYAIHENRKYYKATNPERLLDNLKERQERIEILLPELLDLSAKKGSEAVVELYKGVEGLKVILRNLVRTVEEFYLFGRSRFEEFLPRYYIERIVNAP